MANTELLRDDWKPDQGDAIPVFYASELPMLRQKTPEQLQSIFRVCQIGLWAGVEGEAVINRLAADHRANLIRVELRRGCYLLLTWGEYAAGVERGKRERRSLRMGGTRMNDKEFLMDWLNESDLLLGKANQDYSSMTKPTGNQR
jgi:hypothetical protein